MAITIDVHLYHHVSSEASALDKLTELLALARDQKELLRMANINLERLDAVTNKIAVVVEEVVAAEQAEDAKHAAAIQILKDELAAKGVETAAATAAFAELEAGLGVANPRLEALVPALEAIGATPNDPLPEPIIPPAEPVA